MELGRWKVVGILVLVMGLAACAPNSLAVKPAPLGQMQQQTAAYLQQEYVIAPGDVLDVKFMYNPEFNELAMPVRPDGRISLQLAPDMKAAGLTASQLRAALSEKYATELKTPEVAVIVRSFAENRVFVDGEVVTPGFADLGPRMTVMRAIDLKGGMRETARLSQVIIIRKDFEGQPKATVVDLRKVINGSDLSQDIKLMPYDIVYVPKSNIARVDKWVTEYISGIIPPFYSINPYTTLFTTPLAPKAAGGAGGGR
jgi:protein involved in polysaccharide export with SLBB domain